MLKLWRRMYTENIPANVDFQRGQGAERGVRAQTLSDTDNSR